MKIQANPLQSTLLPNSPNRPEGKGQDFGKFLKDALLEVNTLQAESDVAFERLITGDIEFHDAMIIAEKANLALQLTMAIRTKLLESYQEIMRMQV